MPHANCLHTLAKPWLPCALRGMGLAALVCAWGPAAVAQPYDLETAVNSISVAIKKVLEPQSVREIAVGDFDFMRTDDRSQVDPNATGGTALRQRLIKSLSEHGLQAVAESRFSVQGCIYRDKADGDIPILDIQYKIKDNQGGNIYSNAPVTLDESAAGEQVREVDPMFVIGNQEQILSLTGTNLPPSKNLREETPDQRDRRIREAWEAEGPRNQAEIAAGAGANTRINPLGAPFGIEIWAGRDSELTPRPAEFRNGEPFIRMAKGENYFIRLYNGLKHELAAWVAIDGLNTFDFRAQDQAVDGFWIQPPGHGDIQGWYHHPRSSSKFLVDGLDTVAEVDLKLLDPKAIGSITVVFGAAWPEGTEPPADEPLYSTKGGNLRTVLGGPIEQKLPPIRRVKGVPRASVTVRYDR
jgi:hypothetical protein